MTNHLLDNTNILDYVATFVTINMVVCELTSLKKYTLGFIVYNIQFR